MLIFDVFNGLTAFPAFTFPHLSLHANDPKSNPTLYFIGFYNYFKRFVDYYCRIFILMLHLLNVQRFFYNTQIVFLPRA